MTRPNITKFQESEIKRAAKAAYFRYLASWNLWNTGARTAQSGDVHNRRIEVINP